MKEFILKQVGTQIPAENVQDVSVALFEHGALENILFVQTKEGWVRVNLTDGTFAVGEYEG